MVLSVLLLRVLQTRQRQTRSRQGKASEGAGAQRRQKEEPWWTARTRLETVDGSSDDWITLLLGINLLLEWISL